MGSEDPAAHCGKKHRKINIVLLTREAGKKINEKRTGRKWNKYDKNTK
jgi:hypothetical protein